MAREIIKRDPFDQVCACGFETETHVCLCVKRQSWGVNGPCPDCKGGHHKMRLKRVEEPTP
jgi:hypothetical protein